MILKGSIQCGNMEMIVPFHILNYGLNTTRMSERSKMMARWWHGFFSMFGVQSLTKRFNFQKISSYSTFRLESGLLGVLQTEEKYYGHGYGSLVTKYVAKKVAEFGFDVYAEVAEDNKPSRSLFNKLGFESVGEVHWILTKATIRSADV